MNVFEHIEKNKPQLNVTELLLYSIAKDTREMLEMSRSNQKYIEMVANGGNDAGSRKR